MNQLIFCYTLSDSFKFKTINILFFIYVFFISQDNTRSHESELEHKHTQLYACLVHWQCASRNTKHLLMELRLSRPVINRSMCKGAIEHGRLWQAQISTEQKDSSFSEEALEILSAPTFSHTKIAQSSCCVRVMKKQEKLRQSCPDSHKVIINQILYFAFAAYLGIFSTWLYIWP